MLLTKSVTQQQVDLLIYLYKEVMKRVKGQDNYSKYLPLQNTWQAQIGVVKQQEYFLAETFC